MGGAGRLERRQESPNSRRGAVWGRIGQLELRCTSDELAGLSASQCASRQGRCAEILAAAASSYLARASTPLQPRQFVAARASSLVRPAPPAMLSRAAVRLAAARPLLAPLSRAPAAAYVRTYAKDVKHRATKKSNPYESSPNVARPKPRPVPESSQETAEFNPAASPDKNTAPQSPPAPGKPKSAAEQSSESADFSRSQPEFESPQSTEANTAPGNASQAQKPLPDLRHGIPSTFAEEFLKSTPSSKEDAPEPKPNVTEDPQYEKAQDEASGGGYGDREGGELPKSAYETSTDRKRNLYANITMVMGGTMLATSGLYLGREWDSEQEAKQHPDIPSGWSPSAVYARARARLSGALGYYTEPVFPKLLPDVDPAPPYTLVLSLEDLLVHSEWTREHGWRFAKRPGVDFFLRYLCQYYELVIFTSLPLNSADPIIRKLDPFRIVMWPLFREATRYEKGQYVKASYHCCYPTRPSSLTDF